MAPRTPKRRRWQALLLLLMPPCLATEPAKVDTSTPAGQAFSRMYAFDFPGAYAILDKQIQAQPEEPLTYTVKAAAHLFSELNRLKILQMEFFEDDDRVVDKKKLTPDLKLREDFFRLLEAGRKRANARLAANPNDREGLFTLCMAAGLQTDYAALVERRRFGSFLLARQTQVWVKKLQALKPPVYDAYLAVGSTEYVIGSMPWIFRIFVRVDNIEGSKEKGIAALKLVTEKGRYYSPFARILLATIYLREKQFANAERALASVSAEYPENQLVARELQRIREFQRKADAAKAGKK